MLGQLLLLCILFQQWSQYPVKTQMIKCSHDNIDQPPPIDMPSEPKVSKGPKFHFVRDNEFIPYKVLFLIDETIPEPDFSKFKAATDYVNERLSKFLKAKRLIDLRFGVYQEAICSNCAIAKLPSEYVMPKCVSVQTPMKPNENASDEVIERGKENYTLVVRVLSNKIGIGTGQYDEYCTGLLAIANHCPFAHVLGGATHGYFVFCDRYAELTRGDKQLRSTALHETLHIVLPELTGHREPSYGCANLDACKGKTWKEVTRTMTNERGERKTTTSILAITEPVRDAARAHFNCPHAEGLELDFTHEYDGRISTTAHWSMRLFPDEILAPFDAPAQKLSNLTMSALAAQSSWYKVDFSYAEELIISKPSAEMGCSVYEKTCHEFLNEQRAKGNGHRIAPYCDMSGAGANLCSSDHKIQLRCWMDQRTNCTTAITYTGYYDSHVCDGAALMVRARSRMPFLMGSPEGSTCVTLTEVPGLPSPSTHPLCVKHECDIQARMLILQFKPEQLDGLCYVNCSVDLSNKIVTITRDPSCTNARSGHTSLVCPDYDSVCEKKTSTTTKGTTIATASLQGSNDSTTSTTSITDESVPSKTTTSKGTVVTTSKVEQNLYLFALIVTFVVI